MSVQFGVLVMPNTTDKLIEHVQAAEAAGFDRIRVGDSQSVYREVYCTLTIAALNTKRVKLGPGVTNPLTRHPAVTASAIATVDDVSGGRAYLGIGTGDSAVHNLSMRAAKLDTLREYVLALRAIWACWQTGAPLAFEGQFYTHTLMTPFFNPGPLPNPRIPVWLAAVNPYLCRVAGEVADGLQVHPFHTARYIREAILPHVAEGARAAGRRPADVALGSSVFVVTGRDEAEMAAAAAPVREQIAFYASTKGYWPVLEVHGWGEVGRRLHRLAAAGQWGEMASLVSDEMLHEFAVVAPHGGLAARFVARYRGLLDRAFLYLPFPEGLPHDLWPALATVCHA